MGRRDDCVGEWGPHLEANDRQAAQIRGISPYCRNVRLTWQRTWPVLPRCAHTASDCSYTTPLFQVAKFWTHSNLLQVSMSYLKKSQLRGYLRKIREMWYPFLRTLNVSILFGWIYNLYKALCISRIKINSSLSLTFKNLNYYVQGCTKHGLRNTQQMAYWILLPNKQTQHQYHRHWRRLPPRLNIKI